MTRISFLFIDLVSTDFEWWCWDHLHVYFYNLCKKTSRVMYGYVINRTYSAIYSFIRITSNWCIIIGSFFLPQHIFRQLYFIYNDLFQRWFFRYFNYEYDILRYTYDIFHMLRNKLFNARKNSLWTCSICAEQPLFEIFFLVLFYSVF